MIFGLITKENLLLRRAIILARQVIYESRSLHVKATFIALSHSNKSQTVIHKEKWQELLPIIDTS